MVPESVVALLDSGNLLFLDDSGTVFQSLAPNTRADGKLFSKRADADHQPLQPGSPEQCLLDLLTGNNADNAYWASQSNSPNVSNTTVTFDDQGRLNYTLYDGTVHSLISPVVRSTIVSEHFQFARMDPDGIVRAYARPKNGGGNMSWIVSGTFPSDGCRKRTSKLQGMFAPGSYCVETTDRLNCACPNMYSHTDAQHKDSGCMPEFEPQSCDGGENSSSEDRVHSRGAPEHHLGDLDILQQVPIGHGGAVPRLLPQRLLLRRGAAALFIDVSDCAEIAALMNGRQANAVTTKALIMVRVRDPAAKRRKSAMTYNYKVVTACMAFLLVVTIGSLLAWRY
ncbi:G-type lectin S-receptor-like serine/threonine-protein kinase LECRK4 [Setaria viridis]|uniref:G-type lectin S-receptor-like serine/threonine-protein kinase LECRK4 n=1 Tax=Setaria viridis TaxID=4556 RepID=UPI001493757B|nr:G-type lectin S-receptor-like serine/threonine-protein kinase LECRK4 [Setaria viridis]